VLELVCTATGQITHGLIARAADMTEEELFRAARTLRSAHLVRTTGPGRDDSIEPYHDRIRVAVEGHLRPRRRRALNELIADALAVSGAAKTSPHALVGHTLAAGDQAGAAEHAAVAAKHASAATAFDRAADFYRMALELGQHDPDAARALRLSLARSLANAGRGAEAADAYDAAAEGADAALRRDCERLAAEQLLISGHIERGVKRLGQALEAIGEPVLATPRRALLSVLWRRFSLRLRGLKWNERPSAEVTKAERARLQIVGASALGLSMVDTIRGAAFNARFVQIALQSGDPEEVARALGTEATMSSYQASYDRARVFMGELEALAERHPAEPYIQAWLAAARASYGYFQGEFEQCEEQMRRALSLFARVRGVTWELNNSNMFALFSLRYRGELARLATEVAALRRDAERRGDLYMEVSVRRYGGHFRWLLDDRPEEALDDLERTQWPAPADIFHLQDWQRLDARCAIALYAGTVDEILDDAEADFGALSRSLLTRIHTIDSGAAYMRGRLLLASSRARSELRVVERLARRLQKHGGFPRVFAQLLLAGVRERQGNADRAVHHLRNSIALAEEYGMQFHRAVAQRRLAAHVDSDEAAELRIESDAYMRAQGVVAPQRMAEVLLPRARDAERRV